jgi:hypothetical protein
MGPNDLRRPSVTIAASLNAPPVLSTDVDDSTES